LLPAEVRIIRCTTFFQDEERLLGIVFCYQAVPPEIVTRAQQDSRFAEAITSGEDEEAGRLLPPSCERIDVGKAWDGIWFLLSEERRGTDDLYAPSDLLGRAVDGAELLNDAVGMGYDSPRYLSAPLVKRVAVALKPIREEHLRSNFDPVAMRSADVYPGDWGQIGIDYALAQFKKLQSFYLRAADADQAVIVWGS
jgi:hypothetical protein